MEGKLNDTGSLCKSLQKITSVNFVFLLLKISLKLCQKYVKLLKMRKYIFDYILKNVVQKCVKILSIFVRGIYFF